MTWCFLLFIGLLVLALMILKYDTIKESFYEDDKPIKVGRQKCINKTVSGGNMECPLGYFLSRIRPGNNEMAVTCCTPPEDPLITNKN
jgi:hypothetical protein